MDWLPRIGTWLSDNEAMISAIVGIAVLAGIVFTGIRFLMSRRSQPVPEATTKPTDDEDPLLALPTGPVVAVLPFENLSRDPDQEYFSDGLTDDIITALSRFKDLFVIARNSTFRYKGQAVDVRQLNRELGARYVVEGSVQRAESRLRFTAQLLDAKDGTHLWAETYDRKLSASNIFEVQDEITGQVVGTIAGGTGVISRARFAEVKEKPTDRLDAYESVLKYGGYYRDGFVATEHAGVRDALERAVKSDPGYSDAWASLCLSYLDEHRMNFNPRPGSLDRALDAAQRAVTTDPTSQNAYHALAQTHFFRHDLDAFRVGVERAITLNPSNAAILAELGQNLALAGDELGIALLKKAMELDPFHPTWYYTAVADDHFVRGEYEAALTAAKKINLPGFFWPQIHLAAIYAELDRQSEARSALERLQTLYPGFTTDTLTEELKKWNAPRAATLRWVSALRKAGLPDGTEA